MLLSAATEGAAPDVVPQLLNQLWVLLLDLLGKLLTTEREGGENQRLHRQECQLPL